MPFYSGQSCITNPKGRKCPTFLRPWVGSQLLSCIASMRSIVFFTLPPALPETIFTRPCLRGSGLFAVPPAACQRERSGKLSTICRGRGSIGYDISTTGHSAGSPTACPGRWHRIREPCEYTKQQCRISPTTHAATVSDRSDLRLSQLRVPLSY